MRARWILATGFFGGIGIGLLPDPPPPPAEAAPGWTPVVSSAPVTAQSPPPRRINKYADNEAPMVPDGMVRITGDAMGCTSREAFEELSRLQAAGDVEAAKWLVMARMVRDECRVFHDGDVVYLAETALFSGLAAVRRPGEPRAFWTNIERVKTR